MKQLMRHLYCLGQAFGRFFAGDGLVHAGNMAFLGMLSLFPFLIFLIALSAAFGQSETGLAAIQFILENVPGEVRGAVEPAINSVINNSSGELITISILFAIFTASSGVEAARAAVLRAYRTRAPAKPMWLHRLESVGIVFLAAILAIIGMAVQVLGPALIGLVGRFVEIPQGVMETLDLTHYLISPVAILLALYALYLALTPWGAYKRVFRLPGALFAMLVWLLTASGFSAFLKSAPGFDVTYGGLAGVVVALLFLFVVSIGFIIGAELNAAYARVFKPAGRAIKKVDAAKEAVKVDEAAK